MTEIDLITGILGSGKTTFIRKYARHLIDRHEVSSRLTEFIGKTMHKSFFYRLGSVH